MPIILDIYGVAYTGIVNKNLFDLTETYRAKGEKVYLASNVEIAQVNIFMNDYGFGKYADGIFCSEELGVAKPNNGFYHQVTQRIDTTPGQIIFFDDSLANIDSAQTYGWHAHLYTDVQDVKNKIDHFLKD